MRHVIMRLVAAGLLVSVVSCSSKPFPGPEPAAGTDAKPAGVITPEPGVETETTSGAVSTPKPAAEPVRTEAAEVRRGVHVFVSGRVQGVGFRAFTQRSALELGVTGWVRNLADGRVEAVAEGSVEAINKFLEAVNRGPQAARVDKVELTEQKPTGEFKTFEVRR